MLETRANKNVRKNDVVMVISGKNRGKSGRILKIQPEKNICIIEKVNFIKKHQRPNTQNKQGGIVEREAGVKLDIVMIVCPKCAKPVRIRIENGSDGIKKRLCASCRGVIEIKK